MFSLLLAVKATDYFVYRAFFSRYCQAFWNKRNQKPVGWVTLFNPTYNHAHVVGFHFVQPNLHYSISINN